MIDARVRNLEFEMSDETDGIRSATIPRHTVDVAINEPLFFSPHELRYMKNNLPYEGETLGVCAFYWAQAVGNREEMAEIVAEHAPPEKKAAFATRINTYKQKMKETVSSAKEAYFWAIAFPEDSDEFIDLVHGDEWAYKWAKNIGDEEEMESRISHGFWTMKFEKEILDDDKKSFASP